MVITLTACLSQVQAYQVSRLLCLTGKEAGAAPMRVGLCADNSERAINIKISSSASIMTSIPSFPVTPMEKPNEHVT